MKKIISIMLSLCFVLLSLSGCARYDDALPLNDIVTGILAENGIEKSKITYLCDSNDNKYVELYNHISVEITDDELQKYVDDMLLVHEKMIEITDRDTVQKGDAIVVNYVVYFGSQIVANAENEPLVVGAGSYGEEFEKAVVGATVGEPFTCELSSPVDTKKYKKGDTLKYNITVESINYFESYTSSDKYILDYYGCQSEKELFDRCKEQLKQQKSYENSLIADNEFLEKVSKDCKFYIDKQEAAAYSQRIVAEHKDLAYISGLELDEYISSTLGISEDEFYDNCYNAGVAEIKQYLLVGASCAGSTFDGEGFAKFCSMSGYDSTQADNTQAKYSCLKTWTVHSFAHTGYVVSVGFRFNLPERKQSVQIYDSSNINTIDFSADKEYEIPYEIADNIIYMASRLTFGYTGYENYNHLYDTVLVFEDENKEKTFWMIDHINGYIKWQTSEEGIVYTELPDGLREWIAEVKQG